MEDVGVFHGHLVYLRPFGIFNGYLVHFPRFGMLYQEKSGNPGYKDDKVFNAKSNQTWGQ
jgi:hypothetical protein